MSATINIGSNTPGEALPGNAIAINNTAKIPTPPTDVLENPTSKAVSVTQASAKYESSTRKRLPTIQR